MSPRHRLDFFAAVTFSTALAFSGCKPAKESPANSKPSSGGERSIPFTTETLGITGEQAAAARRGKREEVSAGVKYDPRKAAESAFASWGENQQSEEMLLVMREWFHSDPEAALAWLKKQPDSPSRTLVWIDLARTLASEDPVRALEFAAELSHPDSREELSSVVLQKWTETDPKAASKWIEDQPSLAARENLQSRLSIAWAQRAPADAAEYVATQMQPGPAQDEAAITVVRRWGFLAPADAVAWASAFPESELRQIALSSALSEWVYRDAETARAWIEKLPKTQESDGTLAAFLASFAEKNGAAAADLAMRIVQEDRRQEELGNVLQKWALQDEPAARDWLAKSSLPAALQRQLLPRRQ